MRSEMFYRTRTIEPHVYKKKKENKSISFIIYLTQLKYVQFPDSTLPRLWLNKYLSVLYYKYNIHGREEEMETDLRK